MEINIFHIYIFNPNLSIKYIQIDRLDINYTFSTLISKKEVFKGFLTYFSSLEVSFVII